MEFIVLSAKSYKYAKCKLPSSSQENQLLQSPSTSGNAYPIDAHSVLRHSDAEISYLQATIDDVTQVQYLAAKDAMHLIKTEIDISANILELSKIKNKLFKRLILSIQKLLDSIIENIRKIQKIYVEEHI